MSATSATYIKTVHLIVRAVSFVYHKTHWFTDKEAWMLYRMFAFAETAGWTMLISAIAYRAFGLPGSDIAISIAGTVHGLLFSLYFIFVLITARSMLWGGWRVAAATLAGMPPYVSLIFEKVMAYDRKKRPILVEPPLNLE